MILTGSEIEKEVSSGGVIIEPFDPKCINPNSYNYHLGDVVREVQPQSISGGMCFDIPEEGVILKAERLYLSTTLESLGSHIYAMSLIGRSSIGRLGLFVQISADLGHQGSAHKWTLELRATQNIRVYPRMRIGQVSFWKTSGKRTKTEQHYANISYPGEGRVER